MLTWTFIKLVFTSYSNTSMRETILLKIFHLYSLYPVVIDWVKLPALIYMIIVNPSFFGVALSGVVSLNAIAIFVWNYWACRYRPDIQVTFVSIITFPLYKILSSMIRVIAMLRCALVYWPRHSTKDFRPKLLTEGRIGDIEKYEHLGLKRRITNMKRAFSKRKTSRPEEGVLK
eukprot:NODE_274_length_10990_cov_0.767606.p7 type:complete len:174 gc:universal NODE_274_length_10990_cov_0.767606:6411-6932(+)